MSGTRMILCEALLEGARTEKQVEIIRQLLCELPHFHPYPTFKALHSSKGFISQSDIENLLVKNGFPAHSCDTYISNYDHDLDGTLSYSEFLHSILPNMNQDLRQSITLKQPFLTSLDPQIEYTIARLIDKEINLTLAMDPVKLKLGTDYAECFNMLDGQQCEKLILSDFEQFFNDSKLIIYPDEVVAIFKRIDLRQDGIIDREELYRFLQPRKPTAHLCDDKAKLSPRLSPPKKPFVQSSKRFIKPVIEDSKPKTPIKQTKTSKNAKRNKPTPKSANEPSKRANSDKKVKQDQKYFEYKTSLRAEVNKLRPTKLQQQSSGIKTQQTLVCPEPTISKTQPALHKRKGSVKDLEQKRTSQWKHSSDKKTIRSSIATSSVQNALESPGYVYSKILYTMCERESVIELTKQNLSLRSDFNLFEGFAFFDQDRSGYITCEDLDGKLKQTMGFFQPLIVRFGLKARLEYKRFVSLMLPQSSEYAEAMQSRQYNQYAYGQVIFTPETLNLLTKVLLLTNERELQLITVKQSTKELNAKDIFKEIDTTSSDGLLDIGDFMQFFTKHGFKSATSDVKLLVSLLDGGEGKVGLIKFLNVFSI